MLAPSAALFTLLVATAGGYGFHRHELHFMVNAEASAWGYVDHPPLTPMVGWLSQQIFGDTVRGLRTLPALVAALTVVVVALICRELGGSAGAQLLAARHRQRRERHTDLVASAPSKPWADLWPELRHVN